MTFAAVSLSLILQSYPIVLCSPIDESLRISSDYEWLLRELKERDAKFLDGPIIVGMQAGGMSSQASRGCKVSRKFSEPEPRTESHQALLLVHGLV
jgi:hypothetical protein